MFTNSKATIYNKKGNVYVKNVIEKVFWDTGVLTTIGTTILTDKTSNSLIMIPYDVSRYLTPKLWENWELIPDGLYTFDVGSKDFIVKGECDYEWSVGEPITELLKNYENVLTVTEVNPKLFGTSDMWHFEIRGAV